MTKIAQSQGETGVMVHFLGTVAVHTGMGPAQVSILCEHGSEFLLTAEIIAANRGRDGRWRLLELLGDDEGQRREFGRVLMRPGPWPTGVERIEPGSFAWDQARADARAAANTLPTERERTEALAKVRAKYGIDPSACSRTLGYVNR
ncbi:hypothetical protein [Angustibacter sp. Root456]|uniref:hypothetical protein n=1 Tax=Angustibacter sp. Root456 TaxID=1736539 RepID=UPI0006FA9D5E|nr:hypothetical protein [Angustibacter sp. Root456]KQX68823.1 hypothetical protein ASD06_17145 [Angustibacter sp. Root456]